MFSEPVVGEKFYGRSEVLELLNKRVSALKEGYRQNVALTGQSLAGKSSIIMHFLNSIKEEGFVPVYVEVTDEPFRQFSNKFLATLLYNTLTAIGEEAGIEMSGLLERAREKLPKTSLLIKVMNSHIEKNDIDEAYSTLLALTSSVKEETGLPCIVILDEFDNLEHLGIKNPFLSFGKVIMVQKDTMYIVSSSRDSAIKKILSEKLSLLFGNFEVVKVSNFNIETASAFVDTKLAGSEIEPRMKEFLISLTDGNPFYLDKLSGAARKSAEERMSGHVSEGDVLEALLKLVYDANGVIHQYLMNYTLNLLDSRQRDPQMSILTAIANQHRKLPDMAKRLKIKMGEASKALDRLAEIALISKNGLFYKIDDTMLEFWLKHVYQRRRELLVDGAFNKERLFRKDIASYIAAFVEKSSHHYVTRLADLFNLFSNELVQIDNRNLRLPHFTRVEARSFDDGTGSRYIACSFRSNHWIVQPHESSVTETDIINFIRNTKTLDFKIASRVIIPLKGIDDNANLLAKELKIMIWNLPAVNMLLGFYGRQKIVIL